MEQKIETIHWVAYGVGSVILIILLASAFGAISIDKTFITRLNQSQNNKIVYDNSICCPKTDANFTCGCYSSSLKTGTEISYPKGWYFVTHGAEFFLAINSDVNPIPKYLVKWREIDLASINANKILKVVTIPNSKTDTSSPEEYLIAKTENSFKNLSKIDGYPAALFSTTTSSTNKDIVTVGYVILRNKDLVTITLEDRVSKDYNQTLNLLDSIATRFRFIDPLDPKIKD
jgi:hypothetical protein